MKIQKIVREINLTEPDIVPFVPYYADCVAMDDSIPAERMRGIENGIELFKRGFIDEVRLYGDRLSGGMAAEIELAKSLNIPIVPMTSETKTQYYLCY